MPETLLFLGSKYRPMRPRLSQLASRFGLDAEVSVIRDREVSFSRFQEYLKNGAVFVPWRQYAISLSEYRKSRSIDSSRLILLSGVESSLGDAMAEEGLFDAFIPIAANLPKFVESYDFSRVVRCLGSRPNLSPIRDRVYCAFYAYLDEHVGEFGVLDYIESMPKPITKLIEDEMGRQSAAWPHRLPQLLWETRRSEKRWVDNLTLMCRGFTTEWEERNMKMNGEMFARPFWGLPSPIDGGEEVTCFAIMPFAEPFQQLYKDHIHPILEELAVRTRKADDLSTPSRITQDVWDLLNAASFLIADTTGQNPNVMYEIGLAHAVGKPVILLSQSIRDCPFDLKDIRHILYDLSEEGRTRLRRDLAEAVSDLIDKTND